MTYESEMRFSVEADDKQKAIEIVLQAEDAVRELPGVHVWGATCKERQSPFEDAARKPS